MTPENIPSPETTLQNAADTILERSVPIVINIKPKNRAHRWLQKLNWLPTKKEYRLHPLCLGSLVKISRLILSIQKMEGQSAMEQAYMAISDHADRIIEVIAIAIVNQETDPPKDLIKLIRSEFTPDDMARTLALIVEKMSIRSFLISIISVRGLNVLAKKEMSPNDQRSQIASGAPLEE